MIKYNKCIISQNTANGICNGSTGLTGRFGGGDELSHGLVCIMAQRYADKECNLEKEQNKTKLKIEKQQKNLYQQILINDRLTTKSIIKSTTQYLEPIKKIIIDDMFEKSTKIKIIDKVMLKHPITNQMYVFEIPDDVKQMIISINGLTTHGDLICKWLKNNKLVTLDYYNNYKEFNNEFEKLNIKCKYLLEDALPINTFEKGINVCKKSYPTNYFNVGNPVGYSKNVHLDKGISLNYSVSGNGYKSASGGGGEQSIKMGGWEIIGTALLTVTIKFGGTAGLCIIS